MENTLAHVVQVVAFYFAVPVIWYGHGFMACKQCCNIIVVHPSGVGTALLINTSKPFQTSFLHPVSNIWALGSLAISR